MACRRWWPAIWAGKVLSPISSPPRGIGVVIACFAEVASQFGAAGGPYLYAREAFGRFIGLEIGWLLLLVRLTAAAAAANLFTNYLAEFWPAVEEPFTRLGVLTILIGFLAAANYRGVKSGAAVSNIFTVAKLAPLFAFAAAGMFLVLRAHPEIPAGTTFNAPASYPKLARSRACSHVCLRRL